MSIEDNMIKKFVIFPSIVFLILLALNDRSEARNIISTDIENCKTCHEEKSAEGNVSYVGSEICASCHAGFYDAFLKSVHGKKMMPDSPANKGGCESCHGPGSAHVEKGGGREKGIYAFTRKADARNKSLKCLICHEESKSLAFWNMSRHKSADVSCENCHSIHSGTEKYLNAAEPELCFSCHKDIRSQANRQSHHPLKENKIKCSSCHNPMGSFGIKMVKADSVNELCYQCHAERRGPFMWEHPPVEEKCLNCHVPHGSNHSKLLEKRVPFLCQSCHDDRGHPGTIYTSFETFKGTTTSGKNKMFARSCLNCHSNIHGSNGPAARGSHWLR
jgi:DmsE family decaheme c-type cytochrome